MGGAPTNHNVGALLKARAAQHPDRPALIFADGRRDGGPRWTECTFGRLDRESDRFAAGLAAEGLKRGDRVLFLMRPSIPFYAVLFGAIKLGAVPVLVDPGMGLRNVLACVGEIRPRALIAAPLVHAIAAVVRRPFASADLRITAGRRWFWGGRTLGDCLGPDAPFPIPHFGPDDEVGIVFTSGSTGTPKGVTYTHGIFHAVATLADERVGRGPGRRYLECFAAYVLFDVAQGMTAVVPDFDLSRPATARPEHIVEAITAHRCTGAFASPVILRNLFRYCARTGTELPSLEAVLTGVAPIHADLHRGLRATNPHAVLHVVYGATEGMTVAHTDSHEVLGDTWKKTGRGAGTCVGRPFPRIEIRIVAITDEPIPTWDQAVEVADGEIGEIVIRGAVVSPEYKERPDANALAKIADGDTIWHRTGDLGYRDEAGRLWFCGRKAHRLETPEGTIPAVPVEGVFNEHPGVARTALVGVGPRGREVPVLLVELEADAAWEELDIPDLLARADGTRWAGVVRRVLHHPGFPVDARHNSKIRRRILKTWAESRAADLLTTISPASARAPSSPLHRR